MADKRISIKYTNENGDNIFFGDSAPVVYLSHVGLDSMSASPNLEKAPYQIGKTSFGNSINERPLTIKFAIIAKDEEESEELRRRVIKAFNPTLSGKLEIFSNTKDIAGYDCLVTSTPKFKDDDYELEMQYIMEGQVSVTVPEGFLADISDTYFTLTKVTPLFEFPFEYEIGEEFEMGTLSFGGIDYDNLGDCETPIIVKIKGPVKTPKLTNTTTGEFIKVNIPIAANETMMINTSFINKEVIIINDAGEERNAFHYIDLESTFFRMLPGMNHLEFWAEEGNDTAEVDVTFKRRWTGI